MFMSSGPPGNSRLGLGENVSGELGCNAQGKGEAPVSLHCLCQISGKGCKSPSFPGMA